jgi:ribosomal protein RSM22 (predicted rRNA methylase)
MPATFAAIQSALIRLREAVPGFAPTSCVDLGAGPGTATLAARDLLPSLQTLTLVERDGGMLQFAQKFVPDAHFSQADLASADIPAADLIICAYALNELTAEVRERVLTRAWQSTRAALVIVEPGSPVGFKHILSARRFFIGSNDATIAAPCPGHMPCSLEQVGDWCHFSARVQRSSLHRRLKNASLPYEDEKFSYVIAVKKPVVPVPAAARIVRRPEKLKGHVKLQLCTIDGLKHEAVTQRTGPIYKESRDTEWGDAWPPTPAHPPQ